MLFIPVLDIAFQAYSTLNSIYNEKKSVAANENKDMFMYLNINLCKISDIAEKICSNPEGKESAAASRIDWAPGMA